MRLLMGNIVGVIAGVLGASMAMPQAYRAIRRGVEGVSSATFQIFLVNTIGWTIYGFHQHLTVSIWTNITLSLCNLVILLCLLRDGDSLFNTTKVILTFAPFTALIFYIDPTWLAWWGGALSIALRTPQAAKLRKSEDISGISKSTWILGAVSNFFWTLYGIFVRDWRIAIVCAVVSFTSAMLVVAISRKHQTLGVDVPVATFATDLA